MAKLSRPSDAGSLGVGWLKRNMHCYLLWKSKRISWNYSLFN